MPSLETLLLFTAAALVLNISPGPSNFYVMARSLGQGMRAGLLAACGLALGSLVHVAAAALGLSALFVYSPTAFTLLKLAGAAYLVWLGIRHLRRASGAPTALAAAARKSSRRILGESFAVEALNPKTALFFLAFLPQFVDPAAAPVAPQILLLGAIVTVSAMPCDALVAAGAGSLAGLIARRSSRASRTGSREAC
jgi:threonine/homoserine/homoserine lactone efflux protein